jgi:hypothetical protein
MNRGDIKLMIDRLDQVEVDCGEQSIVNDACVMLETLRWRLDELESTIKSHGIPVKTYAGGEAHYCTGVSLDTGVVYTKDESCAAQSAGGK